jgi:hypothetical protein
MLHLHGIHGHPNRPMTVGPPAICNVQGRPPSPAALPWPHVPRRSLRLTPIVTTQYGLLHYANLIRWTGPIIFFQLT